MYVLATKKRKISQKGSNIIFKARKLRNAGQILDLARPEKIWPRSQKPKKIKRQAHLPSLILGFFGGKKQVRQEKLLRDFLEETRSELVLGRRD